jgi:hypothetical protein
LPRFWGHAARDGVTVGTPTALAPCCLLFYKTISSIAPPLIPQCCRRLQSLIGHCNIMSNASFKRFISSLGRNLKLGLKGRLSRSAMNCRRTRNERIKQGRYMEWWRKLIGSKIVATCTSLCTSMTLTKWTKKWAAGSNDRCHRARHHHPRYPQRRPMLIDTYPI